MFEFSQMRREKTDLADKLKEMSLEKPSVKVVSVSQKRACKNKLYRKSGSFLSLGLPNHSKR